MYLNLVPYGGNLRGVKSASILYFKEPRSPVTGEITALSIIPNRPSSLVIGKAMIRSLSGTAGCKICHRPYLHKKEIADALQRNTYCYTRNGAREIPHLAYRLKRQGGQYHSYQYCAEYPVENRKTGKRLFTYAGAQKNM